MASGFCQNALSKSARRPTNAPTPVKRLKLAKRGDSHARPYSPSRSNTTTSCVPRARLAMMGAAMRTWAGWGR